MNQYAFDEAGNVIDPVLALFSDQLEAVIMQHTVTAYINGSAQMVEYGRTLATDRPIYFEGPPMQDAINWANERSAQLVTKMNQETKDRLAKVVGNAIDNKRGVPGLARDIRNEFDLMTKYRSRMIARTETAQSLSEGSAKRMKDMGVTGKRWVTVGDDKVSDICMQNQGRGAIPIDDTFPSGNMHPPAHPNCRCVSSPVMLKVAL